jgi:transcriptional regulator with XRE-family HTH domain
MSQTAENETAPKIDEVLPLFGDLDSMKRRGAATDDGTRGIAHRLAQIRKARGMSQKELSARLGISQPIVSDYEHGTLRIHGELLGKLSHILGVSADEILGLKALRELPEAQPRKLLKRFRAVQDLPAKEQQKVLDHIDTVVQNYRFKRAQ